jgi:polysaccharide biosynthesis/export protein
MSLNGRLTRACCVLVVLTLGACGWLGGLHPGSWLGMAPDLPPIPETVPGAYHLGPGDQVRILTLGEDRLTGEFRVNDSGALALPLLGTVPAAGLTTAELEQTLSTALVKAQLILEPSVAVEVSSYRPIFVLGEVNKPGQYPYQSGMTVVTAVAVAGGFTYRAVEDRASIVRTIDGKAVEGRAERQTYVQPGDVITIYERRF